MLEHVPGTRHQLIESEDDGSDDENDLSPLVVNGSPNDEDAVASRRPFMAAASPTLKQRRPYPRLPVTNFACCSYDSCQNFSYKTYTFNIEKRQKTGPVRALRWAFTFLIGVTTAMVAYFIDYFVNFLLNHKHDWVTKRIADGQPAAAFFVFLGTNAGFVLVAALLVLLAPVAGGSGIPEVKVYLNGLRLPGVLSLRTFVAKVVGVLFSVAGGLPCGKEGPMIHSGAVLAAGWTQGLPPRGFPWLARLLGKDAVQRMFLPFRDDRNKRDFVSCGAAAGVAAAFGAPVGGVLFAVEEGCSFYDVSLAWRIFFCAIVCAFSMAFATNTSTGAKSLNSPGMIDFGDFAGSNVVPFSTIEIPCFVVIGAAGGLAGALFIHLNLKLTAVRKKRDDWLCRTFGSRARSFVRTAEPVCIVALLSLLCFFDLYALPRVCQKVPPPSDDHDSVKVRDLLQTLECDAGHYDAWGTLWFNSAADSLRFLFHFSGHFDHMVLLGFGAQYFVLMTVTYGAPVPSGLFLPSLLAGAVFGRLFGQLLKEIDVHTFSTLDPGAYALIGAASFLGGVCRITFSLTVILIEATRDIAYSLPIMFAILSAKFVGDYFNRGIYDEHIHFRKLAFLEASLPEELSMRTFVHDFMTPRSKLNCFDPVERVSVVLRTLQTRRYIGFPIARCDKEQLTEQFHYGLMTRSRLLVLLSKKAFSRRRKLAVSVKALRRAVDACSDVDLLPETDLADTKLLISVMEAQNLSQVVGESTDSADNPSVKVN
eukprot:gene15673-23928_t